MQLFDIKRHPHTRLNLLTGETVLVSPHRTSRPWQGKMEALPSDNRPSHDPSCYLCPGNARADGSVNPEYKSVFVFVNDYSTLLHDTPQGSFDEEGLLVAKSERGICKVISFSPDHSLTLPLLSVSDIKGVIEVWCREFESIAAAYPEITHIQIFENKGEIMGCSNPHPHGQIWAQTSLPQEVSKETRQQKIYFEKRGTSLLSDYLQLELSIGERVILENDSFAVVVPFWAIWPFETLVISKRHVQTTNEFTDEEKWDLAEILKRLTVKYDNLFEIPFPYSSGIHQAPVNRGTYPEWHWHMHFYPPLLRSATVKKFMVGYEILANAQRDITAESAAARLKELSEIHYKEMKNIS